MLKAIETSHGGSIEGKKGGSRKTLPPNITHKESHRAAVKLGEIASELYIAREKLAGPGARTDLTSEQKFQGWNTYCKEIGSTRRRLGEMLDDQKRTVGLNPGAATKGVGKAGRNALPTEKCVTPPLREAGIDYKLSSREQKPLDIHR